MTSFSTYASRFLSTGASAAPLHTHNNKHSIYRPFESSEYATQQHSGHHGVQPSSSHEEDDDEPDSDHGSQMNQRTSTRTLPHLQGNPGHTSKMSGSSRLLAQLTGQAARTQRHPTGANSMRRIRDIEDDADDDDDDDEQGNAEDDDEQDAYQNHRGNIHVPSAGHSSVFEDQKTPGASMYATRDEHDPFLAEADLRKAASRSRSRSPTSHFRAANVEAKSRGWLAHAADSSSNSSFTSERPPPRRSNQRVLPDDIYRDPDQSPPQRSRKRNTSANQVLPFSVDDDGDASENDQQTSIASTSDEDEADDNTSIPRKNWRAAGRNKRRAQSGERNNISSTLREPLLSSAGSTLSEHQPPGAFNGTTSRLASADIYAYPHPPAQSGWTPWAPGNRVPLSQYKDKGALLAWLGLCAVTLLVAGMMAMSAQTQAPPSSPSTRPSPYYTLTRSIPILFLLTFISLAAAAGNLLILRNISRVGGASVIRNGLIGIPLILAAGWMWAFAGSFIYDDERWSGGSWSTTGLRVLSVIPLLLAIYFARTVWKRKDSISRSLSVLEISANVVARHPALLLLSLSSLGIFIAISGPFLTIFVRLFLRGHFGSGGVGGLLSNVWQTDSSARLMAWLTLGAWIWTWLVLRGIQRVTVAGVVSHWYFHREEAGEGEEGERGAARDGKLFDATDDDDQDNSLPGPAPGEWLGEEQMSPFGRPSHVDIVRASFIRATGSALGTICLSAMMLSVARVGTTMAASARWTHRRLTASSRWPKVLHPVTHLVALLAGVSALLQGLSDFALIYVGVTGDGFAAAARRATRLTGRQGVKTVMESLVINMLLDLTTLALCFLTGLAGFLISAHNLHVPADAPLVGVLCAFVPYGLLRLCADVLSNAADTLYLCFSIDEASGEQHCKQAAEAFLSTDERLPF